MVIVGSGSMAVENGFNEIIRGLVRGRMKREVRTQKKLCRRSLVHFYI